MGKPPCLVPLRCDASMQSPSAYGRNGYGIEPPPAPDGKARCPVCWKAVKLMCRSGFGGNRIPTHNIDQKMISAKEKLFDAADKARYAKVGEHDPQWSRAET